MRSTQAASSVARQPKAKPAAPLLTPRRLYLPGHGAEAICDIACIAAARCGFDEGEVAAMMMARPVMKATHIFDLIQEPGYEHTEQNLGELLKHFTSAFVTLGGNAAAAIDEWSHLNRMFARDAVLRTLPLERGVFSRIPSLQGQSLQHSAFGGSVVQASAMDVVLAELGVPKLLPSLKREEAGRRGDMLLFLVGHAWLTIRKHDPSLISTVCLVDKWIEMSG